MRTIAVTLALLLLLLAALPARALDGFPEVEKWTARMAETRQVVDRLVVCFDEAAVLREIALWDEGKFWPVLLWDSDLVPKFARAFRPAQTLLAPPGEGKVSLDAALAAAADAWGLPAGATEPAGFLAALRDRGRAPLMAVLLAEGAPETLGGIALVAGRFALPLPFPAEGGHGKVVTSDVVADYRKSLMDALRGLSIAFDTPFDDLDFVTVANAMPFGYTQVDPAKHPGGYTVDDAIARRDDLVRWGWVGRLAGGPERALYAAMGSLFLRPEKGMFFSRYDPNDRGGFGQFDPLPAVDLVAKHFPAETIRHPDATLARWREVMWPAGNRFGFVHVNSSGGATSWSTSGGEATHFDVPDTVPTIVHYTHSGSAGAPFNVDTIAGRWMAGGAYVYFGSYAEPYLGSFVPPVEICRRAAEGVPFGAAMRLLYEPRMAIRQPLPGGPADKIVEFNMSGPWKLAYFGDPMCRLAPAAPRVPPEPPAAGYAAALKDFGKLKPKDDAGRAHHAVARLSLPLLFADADLDAEVKGWSKLKVGKDAAEAAAVQRELVRVWVAMLRRAKEDGRLYAKKAALAAGEPPVAIVKTIEAGAASPEAARLLSVFATEYAAALAAHADSEVGKDKAPALGVLAAALSLPHPDGYRNQFFAWLKTVLTALGAKPEDLREKALAHKWLPDAARKHLTDALK